MSEPFSIAIITGSPVRPSRVEGLAELMEQRLLREGFRVRMLHVRDLPAKALLHAEFNDPAIKEATRRVAQADGVIAVSPVYKAAYSGMLKAFIDLLPQFALRDKVVLPLLVGGTTAHVLAIDYAVRPMLQSLDPRLIVSGLFALDKSIEVGEGPVKLCPEVATRLEQITQAFIDGLRAHGSFTNAAAAVEGLTALAG
ncbi:NADPH-dependent FMN reductase [Pendulispora brunnea]|uniref:NADPH-dependent FMN reductase n=1 Tax=Pendulispora brunnea TaxID=2905690 RepID=A0ABZ2KCY5_9BACT